MLGAAIAARDGKLLTLATGEFLPKGRVSDIAHIVSGTIGAMIATVFTLGGIALVRSDRIAGDQVTAGLPTWLADLALPIGFGLIAVRLVWRASPLWSGRAIALLGIVAGVVLNEHRAFMENQSVVPWFAMVIFAGVLGAPIFALLGGFALFASLIRGNPPVVLPMMAYQELTTSTGIAAIPLFTLAGFLLAEGRSSERLLRVFRAWVGWAPGGTAVAAATLCAFFTLFTGGSGVTILVLGGLLLPALVGDGYRERFSIGLLTASGSLGLLFPLSLPLMLYGIVSQKASIEDLFIGGLLPGLLMLGLLAALGVREGLLTHAQRRPFQASEALAASWEAKWELFLPVFIVGAFLGGVATLVESAPLAALYTLIVQRYIHRDLPTWSDVLRVAADCVALVGGVLLILAVAAGPDRLPRLRGDSDAARRVDPDAHSLAAGVPAPAQCLPAARRHGDGHLLRHRRGRAADPPARGSLRCRLRAPRDHLRREPGARLPAPAARPEPAARVGQVQEARARGHLGHAADARHPRRRRAAHHLRPWLTLGLLHWLGRGSNP